MSHRRITSVCGRETKDLAPSGSGLIATVDMVLKLLEASVFKIRNRSLVVRFGIALTLSLGLTICASAQQYLGTISGNVSDATGAKVVDAAVTATDATTHFVSKGTTNSEGDYTIPSL